ncbi:MAG: hypothetical protein ACREA0_27560, partial [bacterium]
MLLVQELANETHLRSVAGTPRQHGRKGPSFRFGELDRTASMQVFVAVRGDRPIGKLLVQRIGQVELGFLLAVVPERES